MNKTTTITIQTVIGPRALPITTAAREQLEQGIGGTVEAGALIWRRLLDAQRELSHMEAQHALSRKSGVPKSHGYIAKTAEAQILSLVLDNIYGEDVLFWQRNAAIALDTPVGDYV